MNPSENPPDQWRQPEERLSQAPPYASSAPEATPTVEPQVPSAAEVPQEYSNTPEIANLANPEAVDAPQTSPEAASALEPLDASDDTDDDEDNEADSEEASDDSGVDDGEGALLRWQATEHVDQEQGAGWYVILVAVVLALGALAIFVFHSISFAILLPIMLIALVVYVRRPPAMLDYTLSRAGLHINDKLFAYDLFKAFGVVSSDEFHSLVLLPRKRFQVSQTVYFPQEIGESLVDMLAARLPMQEVKLDAVDRLLKKMRI